MVGAAVPDEWPETASLGKPDVADHDRVVAAAMDGMDVAADPSGCTLDGGSEGIEVVWQSDELRGTGRPVGGRESLCDLLLVRCEYGNRKRA